MELTTQELEDIAAGRLVRNALEVSVNPTENLLSAVAAGLLLNELTSAEIERKHIQQSIAIGASVLTQMEAVA